MQRPVSRPYALKKLLQIPGGQMCHRKRESMVARGSGSRKIPMRRVSRILMKKGMQVEKLQQQDVRGLLCSGKISLFRVPAMGISEFLFLSLGSYSLISYLINPLSLRLQLAQSSPISKNIIIPHLQPEGKAIPVPDYPLSSSNTIRILILYVWIKKRMDKVKKSIKGAKQKEGEEKRTIRRKDTHKI
jgi:hypothetical protein